MLQFRTLLPSLAGIALALAGLVNSARAADPPVVKLNWLEGGGAAPAQPVGVSWGVPWPRGTVQKSDSFALKSATGANVTVQSWPLAYWPDGSIKWTGLATSAAGATFDLAVTKTPAPPAAFPALAQDTPQSITINTGTITAVIPHAGENIIDTLSIDNRVVARAGKLTCILQDGAEDTLEVTTKKTSFTSKITKATLEQTGAVRAVVKIEGTHQAVLGAQNRGQPAREFLPFVVRLYFYAGQSSIRMVHTIIYDGDQSKDFIRALGVSFTVPFREEVQNRHVRFSNSTGGLWAEPIQPMIGRGGRFVTGLNGGDAYTDQIEGRRVPNKAQARDNGGGARDLLGQWAVWDDFKLVQPNAGGFSIVKRTNAQSAWLKGLEGDRASGLVFAGDVTGGLAVSLRNFWQSYPASLEVRHASAAAAELNVWMWSPDAPAMDMRHYDTKPHGLEAAYEDVQPGMWTATGVARTSELTLFATPDVPAKIATAQYAAQGATPPLLVATPEYLHAAGVFGPWSLKDTSTTYKQTIEDRLDSVLNYYLKEVDQAKWYGFWYFGNVMHSYDVLRHVWRYDLGGMAWDNSELGPDLWLWYSFLRSGRADVYRMAEAMTRNTGEVAIYHLGKLKGLGTRHGVIPWGDGAKEARISQAAYRRFFYYLSTDERTGDIMREVVDADFSTIGMDPMRLADPPTPADAQYPTRVRAGPDWIAFAGNWMTEWERTGETKYRDKIITGAKCMAAMPYGFRTGTNLLMGYDPKTGQLFQRNNNIGTYNLSGLMGGAEVGNELDTLLDDPSWHKVWRTYCRLYSAPAAIVAAEMQNPGSQDAAGQYATQARLGAYAFSFTQNAAIAQRLLGNIGSLGYTPRPVSGPVALNPLLEAEGNTNSAAEQSLTTIELLELLKNQLPTDAPAGRAGRGGARAGARGGATLPTTAP